MRILWSEPARADLRSIDEWLSMQASPEIAVRTLTKIRERAVFLRQFPHSGRPGRAFRILRVTRTPFLILYRTTSDAIQILAVKHERQDWANLA